MSVARTARRRRKQAVQNYSHLAPRKRPNYKRRDLSVATAHEARLRQREKERRERGGK